jgi:hypothetical protein
MGKDELIKIFVTVSERLERKRINLQGLVLDFLKQMKLNGGVKRHHYLMFKVGRSMFDVYLYPYFPFYFFLNNIYAAATAPSPPNPNTQ